MALPGMSPETKIYIAGHKGMVGSAIWRELQSQGYTNLVGATSKEVDLRNRPEAQEFISSQMPDVIVIAAAKVGGILANSTYPVEFLSDNLRIQTNLLDLAHKYDVPRVLFLGSSCIYPKHAPQPIPEEALLTGPLEPTNEHYALAKIAGIKHVQALRREYGRSYISAMPCNLYGPGDNFDLETSHVVPALIRKFHEAKVINQPAVALWGTGAPLREFLHVDDLAKACIFLLQNYDDETAINVGFGSDITIEELANMIARTVGFTGTIEWDSSKPDGTPRKLLDTSRLNNLGWHPSVSLAQGLDDTYQSYTSHISTEASRL